MSSAGTLYTIPVQAKGKTVSLCTPSIPISSHSCLPCLQIRATAAFGGIAVELPTEYTHYESNKKPEFLAKFPHGKIPAWEGKDGFKLFEGAAIARYSKCFIYRSDQCGIGGRL